MSKKILTYGSLFSGIGGFDLGFDLAGMRCAWQVENDERAQSVLTNHWPNVRKYEDVRDVGKQNLTAVALICGGFPCQDVSLAGRREGLAGERSGLWFEFIRIIGELKPQWVIVENVAGLLSSNGGRDMGTIVGGLAKCGYWWAYRIVDAQYHGVPQRRRRIFIVASLTRGHGQEVLFERESSPWDTPPSREARAGATGATASGVGIGGSELGYALRANPARSGEGVNTNLVIPAIAQSNRGKATGEQTETLRADSHGALPMVAFGGNNTKGPISVATRRNAYGSGRYDFESETFICGALPAHSKRHGHAMGTQQAAESGQIVIAPTITGNIADGNRKGWAPVNESDALIVWDNGQGDPNAEESDISYCPNGQVNQGVGVRRLTPLECERLQGFPDYWTKYGAKDSKIIEQSDSARYRQLGNAVAVPVARWIGQRIIRSLEIE